MKRLVAAWIAVRKFFSTARSAIIANLNFLLTLLKMYLSVGFVIIAAGLLGVLLGLLVPILNYRNGTRYSAGKIWKDLMISLLREAWRETIRQSTYRKNS